MKQCNEIVDIAKGFGIGNRFGSRRTYVYIV